MSDGWLSAGMVKGSSNTSPLEGRMYTLWLLCYSACFLLTSRFWLYTPCLTLPRVWLLDKWIVTVPCTFTAYSIPTVIKMTKPHFSIKSCVPLSKWGYMCSLKKLLLLPNFMSLQNIPPSSFTPNILSVSNPFWNRGLKNIHVYLI